MKVTQAFAPDTHCAHCGVVLACERHGFALSMQEMALHPDPDDADGLALQTLHFHRVDVLGGFCSSACCKAALPEQLSHTDYPLSVKNHRIRHVVIHPCARCGTPVDLTQVTLGCQKNRHRLVTWDGQPAIELVWVDMLAVMCGDCSGLNEAIREAVDDETVRDRSVGVADRSTDATVCAHMRAIAGNLSFSASR